LYDFLDAYKIPPGIYLKKAPWPNFLAKFKQPTKEQALILVNFLFAVGGIYKKEHRAPAFIMTLFQHEYLQGKT
jgi:hypothetical protein